MQKNGMQLCVNNSFSGACVGPSPQEGENTYLDRCIHLDTDRFGWDPDVIFVFIGANDYKNGYYPVGKAIRESMQAGTFSYFYCEMVAKIKERFSAAEIYLLSVLPNKFNALTRQDAEGGILDRYNSAIEAVSRFFGVNYIDLQKRAAISYQNCDRYYFDGLHPNAEGMRKIYTAVFGFLDEAGGT